MKDFYETSKDSTIDSSILIWQFYQVIEQYHISVIEKIAARERQSSRERKSEARPLILARSRFQLEDNGFSIHPDESSFFVENKQRIRTERNDVTRQIHRS